MAKLEAFRTYCSPVRPPLQVLYQITSDPLLNIPEYSMRRMEQHFAFLWTNPSQVIRFQVSGENTKSNGGLSYLCLLALGLPDDAEVEINDVLGEDDNITFIVKIEKEPATTILRIRYLLFS